MPHSLWIYCLHGICWWYEISWIRSDPYETGSKGFGSGSSMVTFLNLKFISVVKYWHASVFWCFMYLLQTDIVTFYSVPSKVTVHEQCSIFCVILCVYYGRPMARIDNRKKNLLSSNISSTCPHNMVNFGPLAAEIFWRVWGTPANFNGFHVASWQRYCTAFQYWTSTKLCGVNQTLRCWTEGATYIRQGGHHVGHWPTF